jgi:hypothetical protein
MAILFYLGLFGVCAVAMVYLPRMAEKDRQRIFYNKNRTARNAHKKESKT